MNEKASLAERVFELVQAIRSSQIDPLELRLTDSYRELQELVADVDNRIDIDEMLNEVLGVKVTKVQELARVLASPEIYIAKLRGKSAKSLAKLLKVKQPVIINRFEQGALSSSLDRIIQLIDSMSKEYPEEVAPKTSDLPNGFALQTEDAVFLEDLERFIETEAIQIRCVFDFTFEIFLQAIAHFLKLAAFLVQLRPCSVAIGTVFFVLVCKSRNCLSRPQPARPHHA